MKNSSIYILLSSVVILVSLGIVMLFSTGGFAQDAHGDMYYFVKRQAVWLFISIISFICGCVLDYKFWKKWCINFFIITFILLTLCFVSHIGMCINGSIRWLNCYFFVFEPSELAKLAVIFFFAWWFSKPTVDPKNLAYGFFIPMMIVVILIIPIAYEVDLGTSVLILSTTLSLFYIIGSNRFLIFGSCISGLVLLASIIFLIPERSARILTFLNPEGDKLGKGLQQWQSLIAFGSGGMEGLGLGEGRQKMLYLPYAHTDFIFPMIGEELGLRVAWLVILCYILIILSGGMISVNTKDTFGKLIAIGIVLIISLQAAINIGMTVALLPNKGMPLPLISYGGSNLVVCCFMVGTLVSIYRRGNLLFSNLKESNEYINHLMISN